MRNRGCSGFLYRCAVDPSGPVLSEQERGQCHTDNRCAENEEPCSSALWSCERAIVVEQLTSRMAERRWQRHGAFAKIRVGASEHGLSANTASAIVGNGTCFGDCRHRGARPFGRNAGYRRGVHFRIGQCCAKLCHRLEARLARLGQRSQDDALNGRRQKWIDGAGQGHGRGHVLDDDFAITFTAEWNFAGDHFEQDHAQ